MNKRNELEAYTFPCCVESEVVMTCFNDCSDTREGPTVVVMDHASIHTSEAFQEEIPKWEQKGLSIFYLPKYSPEMKHLAASYEVSEGKGV